MVFNCVFGVHVLFQLRLVLQYLSIGILYFSISMYHTHSYNGEFCISKIPELELYFIDVSLHRDKVRNIKISKRKEFPNMDFS